MGLFRITRRGFPGNYLQNSTNLLERRDGLLGRTVNRSDLILPAGDVPIGPLDYNIYTNSQLPDIQAIDQLPLKVIGGSVVRVGDVGFARDSHQIQTNIVRVDGKHRNGSD